MSKLFKLKEWLSVADAAKHLAIAFGETVTEADVLKLALDRHLTLSVHLVNGAFGSPCTPIKKEEVEWWEMRSLDSNSMVKIPASGQRVSVTTRGCFKTTDEVLQVGRRVWDLPMIGAEAIDVLQRHQKLINGPEVTTVDMADVFVASATGDLYSIQSTGGGGDPSKRIARGKPFNHPDHFYGAFELPKDSVLVVRTDALRDFEQWVNGAPASAEKSLKTRERDNLLRLVIGMAIDGYGYDPAAAKSNIPKEVAGILAGLDMTVSDDTVRKYLKQAADTVLPAKPHQS